VGEKLRKFLNAVNKFDRYFFGLVFTPSFAFHLAMVIAFGEALVEVAAEEGEEGAGFLVLASVDELVLNDGFFVREVGGEVDAVTDGEAGEVEAGEAA